MRSCRPILVAAIALAAGAPAAAHAKALPTLFTSSGFAVRPATVVYTGDGTGILGKLPPSHRRGRMHWNVWSSRRAQANATVWIDDCNPSCAQGKYHAYSGTVLANRVRNGHFTRLTIRFRFKGHNALDVRALRHNEWAIVRQVGLSG